MAALEDNHTWTVVDISPGKVPIGCKWTFKIKYKSSRKVKKYKAVIVLAASRQWCIFRMDVHNAFLNGDLQEEVYMHIPEGFSRRRESQKVCKLQKSLYGT